MQNLEFSLIKCFYQFANGSFKHVYSIDWSEPYSQNCIKYLETLQRRCVGRLYLYNE